MDLFRLKQEIMASAQLGAAAILKMEKPLSDELTTRQAQAFVGRRWFDRNKEHLTGRRKGKSSNSAIVYSRLEIMALKRAQEVSISELIK